MPIQLEEPVTTTPQKWPLMVYFEAGELYRITAVVQVVLVTGLAFFLNEKRVKKKYALNWT